MSKLIKITEMCGDITKVRCDDPKGLITRINEHMSISIDYFDLFHNDIHVTKSKQLLDVFELEDEMELTIFKSATPLRILDETVIKKGMNNWSGWDIEKMENLFGPIKEWDVSFVSNMCNVFEYNKDFNQDISNWDTSNIKNMRGMFCGAASFDQNISGWDVDNVESMDGMFYDASSFNQDISQWHTSKVTNMRCMFHNASSFNQDISQWDTSKVTNMICMFHNASSFNQDISQWDLRNIEHKMSMLCGAISFEETHAPFYDFNTHT